MIVIRVSYESEAELTEVDRCLWPLRLVKSEAQAKGRFKRAYFKSKNLCNSSWLNAPGKPDKIATDPEEMV